MINLESLLLELSNAPGPSGFENTVREIMKRELSPFVDSLDTDGMGSLIGIKKGPPRSPNIMLSAHMDGVVGSSNNWAEMANNDVKRGCIRYNGNQNPTCNVCR